MERLIGETRGSGRSFWQALAWMAGGVATIAALVVGLALALITATAVVVIALMGTTLLTLAHAARRARRTATARRADPGVIEARNIGGHSWVAYGWDGQRR